MSPESVGESTTVGQRMHKSDYNLRPFQFSLRTFIIAVLSSGLCIALLLSAVLGEGGVFVAPYRLLGEFTLTMFVTPVVFAAPIIAICAFIWLVRFPSRPFTVWISLALLAFGLLHLFTMEAASKFYAVVQILAPTLFTLSLLGFVEIRIRRLPNHLPTVCFVFGLAIIYWHFTLTLAAVMG